MTPSSSPEGDIRERLVALEARLAAATAPDAELDAELWWIAVWGRTAYEEDILAALRTNAAPHYTSSIDAALTLVPDGAKYSLDTAHGIQAAVFDIGTDGFYERTRWHEDHGSAMASTAPLALCLAAIRARIHQAPQGASTRSQI